VAERRCVSGAQCAGASRDGIPAWTRSALCAGCVAELQRALEEIPDLVRALRALGNPRANSWSMAGGPPSRRLPMNVHADALERYAADVLARTGGLRVADLARQPPQEFLVWARGRRVSRLLSGVARALALRSAHRRLVRAVGLHPQWRPRVAPCPRCSGKTLGQWGGSDMVECAGCTWSAPSSQYLQYCVDLATSLLGSE